MTSLLLVEDDDRISQPLVRLLVAEGFVTRHVSLGRAALAAVADDVPDLVLLDLSLPDLDGLDVCRELRITYPSLPIIMLTARGEEVDVVVGLGAGADDYVVKPFRVGELVARIRARVRAASADHTSTDQPATAATAATAAPANDAANATSRDAANATSRDPANATAHHAALDPPRSQPVRGDDRGLAIDRAARRAWVDGAEVALAPKEFDLLDYLAQQPGVTIRRERIMSDVWDEHWWGSTRTLDTHVASLRRKLGDRSDPPRFITTIRGVGLRFESPR